MSSSLNIFEKIHLSLRARRDVKRDLFREYIVSDPTAGIEDCFVISVFINRELGRYQTKREDLHNSRRFLCWSPLVKLHLRRYRLLPVGRVIALLNAWVTKVQSQIHLAYSDYNKTMDILSEQTEQYTQDQAPHYVRACYNQSVSARTAFQKKTRQLYTLATALLNQKVTLLNRLWGDAEQSRAKYFQRIRYYYECASARDPKLPVQFLGDDRLGMIADTSTLIPRYYQELLDAQARLEAMTKEIDELFP